MPVFPLHISLNLFLGEPRKVDSERPARFNLTGENVHFIEEYGSLEIFSHSRPSQKYNRPTSGPSVGVAGLYRPIGFLPTIQVSILIPQCEWRTRSAVWGMMLSKSETTATISYLVQELSLPDGCPRERPQTILVLGDKVEIPFPASVQTM